MHEGRKGYICPTSSIKLTHHARGREGLHPLASSKVLVQPCISLELICMSAGKATSARRPTKRWRLHAYGREGLPPPGFQQSTGAFLHVGGKGYIHPTASAQRPTKCRRQYACGQEWQRPPGVQQNVGTLCMWVDRACGQLGARFLVQYSLRKIFVRQKAIFSEID